MTTEQQVRTTLAKRFDVARLNTGPSGMVYGVVQSEGFRGVAEAERQQRVWDYLRAELGPAALQAVTVLVTMTPEEVRSYLDDLA